MKDIGRTVLLSTWISGIVLAFGCGGDTSPPLAPSPAAVADGSQRAAGKPSPSAVADRGQRAAGNHGPAAAWNDGVGVPASASSVDGDMTGLKSTAPAPVSPTDGAEIDDQTPVLTASKATGVHAAADFEHEFTLFKITGGNRAEIERGRGTSQGASMTSYQVRKKLDLASSYSWRVRAVFDDEHGPWSADAGFRTTAVILGTPRPLSPGNGEAVGIRPVFRVRNGTVEGNAGTVSIHVQVATDGDFAGIVARKAARASSGENTEIRLDDDLMPAKTYFWRARAVSSAGRRPGSWSAVATFKTVAIRLGTPRPLSPIGGATTTTLRPVFKVRNGTVEGHTGVADIRLEVASDADFMKVVGRKTQTAARARGETDLRLSNELMRATRYYWRVRALLASPEVVSGWSATQRFRTPDTATTAPRRGNCCPPPNRFDIVQAVLRRTGNLYREEIQQFTQRVAECLAVTDGDWGRRRNDSGAIGKDTVAYRTSRGRGRGPFSIDIMRGAESNDPRPHWNIQRHGGIDGRVGGSWIAVNGRNCILGPVALQ